MEERVKTIDYLFKVMDISISYYVCAVVLLLVSFVALHGLLHLKRPRAIAISTFVAYVFLVISATLLSRYASADAKYKLQVFWSFYEYWKHDRVSLLKENILNIIMFMPIGLLLSIIIQEYRYRKTAAFSLIFTIFIEVTQLVTHRGLFEFDDIIHNFLGACIGMLIYIVCMERQRKYAKRMTLFIIAYTAIYLAVLLGMYWCV